MDHNSLIAKVYRKKKLSKYNFITFLSSFYFYKLNWIVPVSLVFFCFFFCFWKFVLLRWKLIQKMYIPSKLRAKRRLSRFNQNTCMFRCFLCAAGLQTSLIVHVKISELHAQWHWCLHFSLSFLQFHPCWWPMLILVLL